MRLVILGEGGHAKHLYAQVRRLPGYDVIMTSDDDIVRVDDQVLIGIGTDISKRRELFERFRDRTLQHLALYRWTHDSVHVGWGSQLEVGTIIQSDTDIGDNVLVNTGAQIDHDCKIGDHCVISPGAILCGNVTLGEACAIGAGAIIVQGVTLEPETVIPAGTLVAGPDDFRVPQRMVRGD